MDSFIKQFYEMMAKKPCELHRFYKHSSSFTHCEGQQVLLTPSFFLDCRIGCVAKLR